MYYIHVLCVSYICFSYAVFIYAIYVCVLQVAGFCLSTLVSRSWQSTIACSTLWQCRFYMLCGMGDKLHLVYDIAICSVWYPVSLRKDAFENHVDIGILKKVLFSSWRILRLPMSETIVRRNLEPVAFLASEARTILQTHHATWALHRPQHQLLRDGFRGWIWAAFDGSPNAIKRPKTATDDGNQARRFGSSLLTKVQKSDSSFRWSVGLIARHFSQLVVNGWNVAKESENDNSLSPWFLQLAVGSAGGFKTKEPWSRLQRWRVESVECNRDKTILWHDVEMHQP